MTELVYLDTETTGLDPALHDVWEVAYAFEVGPITSVILPHSLKTADPNALLVNGYLKRYPEGARAGTPLTDGGLRKMLEGKTLVGANPAFDAAFLQRRWGAAPWHYRMLDIESFAMPILGYDRPQGLKRISDDLRGLQHEIPEPDHTAAGDVRTLRMVHRALLRQVQA